MPIRKLPDLTPEQVVSLQDALLANANSLFEAALSLLDLGQVALARSLAILGLEESGKAIAIHDRRVKIAHEPEGTPFRCDSLDALWASHEQKLNKVYEFLLWERYWFGERSYPDENAEMLGTIKRWAQRHDNLKKRGFYVELDATGKPLAPSDLSDEDSLLSVLRYVHQIGWQLRLGEHIEGKKQDEQEAEIPAWTAEDAEWVLGLPGLVDNPAALEAFSPHEALPGTPLTNAAYRFNPPGADRSPFRNLGRPGYEAEDRELAGMAEELERESSTRREPDTD